MENKEVDTGKTCVCRGRIMAEIEFVDENVREFDGRIGPVDEESGSQWNPVIKSAFCMSCGALYKHPQGDRLVLGKIIHNERQLLLQAGMPD